MPIDPMSQRPNISTAPIHCSRMGERDWRSSVAVVRHPFCLHVSLQWFLTPSKLLLKCSTGGLADEAQVCSILIVQKNVGAIEVCSEQKRWERLGQRAELRSQLPQWARAGAQATNLKEIVGIILKHIYGEPFVEISFSIAIPVFDQMQQIRIE